MDIYIDLDCLKKLIACDLLEETLKFFNVSYENVFVLDSFKYSCEDQKKKNKILENVCSKTIKYINIFSKSQISYEIHNIAILENLKKIHNIDEGEALLTFSMLCSSDDCVFLCTGDKRFLQALEANIEDLREYPKLKNKFIHFEQILYSFCENATDFTVLKEKLTTPQASECDGVVKLAFNKESTKERSMEALKAYKKSFYSSYFSADI